MYFINLMDDQDDNGMVLKYNIYFINMYFILNKFFRSS